jgi:hypothetical protein
MGQPVFFVVERTPTGEQPALYYDELPSRHRSERAAAEGLIYAVRVDILPHADQWLSMTLADLYAAYCKARDGNIVLPQNTIEAAKTTERAKPLLGHREKFRQHARPDAEPFAYPSAADSVRRRGPQIPTGE